MTGLSLTILCIVGLMLRLMMTAVESRHLRWAWDWLRQEPDHSSGARRAVVLNRTHQVLSAVRLTRLAALVLLVPAGVMLVELRMPADDALWLEMGALLLAVVALYFLFIGTTGLLMRGFYRPDRTSSRSGAPRWLSEETERMPAPLAAGALLWEWLVRQAKRFTPGMSLVRPKARVYELEGDLVMAVGESELDALEARQVSAHMQREDKSEHDMIRSIRRLDQTLVREVMRPINKISVVPLGNLTAEKFLKLARRTGYTRFPCYNDQVTNLIGYLNVHDFLEKPSLPKDLRKMVHPILFLPEIARVDLALQEMLRARSQIAACYDEFGGCSGLLSREDIIEEITGEIMDEYDRPESTKLQEAHGHYLVDATIDLDDLNEALGMHLEKKHCETLAGFLYQRFNRTPRRGEVFDEKGWRLEVFQMDKHVIRRVRIVPPHGVDSAKGEAGHDG